MINNAYQQYQNSSIFTASPQELTLMLYNGAIKFCNQAKDALEKGDIPKSHNCLIKSQDIIMELQTTLDHKYEVAKGINEMYIFIMQLLKEANINKDADKLDQAIEFIVEFRDVWQQAMKSVKKQ